jgi:hypothetical protein
VAINISLLRETGGRLGQMADALGQAQGTGSEDAHSVRQRDLTAAMHEFATNWKTHREKLIDQVSGGHKFVTGAVEAYERLDNDLAAGLNSATDQAQ